jgi:hypothetical protein
MGEPRICLLKRRQSAPDVFAKEMTVRELLDRRAGRAAQGYRYELARWRRRAGAPFFFGYFLLGRARRK